MYQNTHYIRRVNWLNIITQCQERHEGVTVKQWISGNGVKEKAYYYWLRKFHKEANEQMQPMVAKEHPGTDITFAEMTFPEKAAPDCAALTAESNDNPVAVIRYNGVTISISGDISDGLLSKILGEVSNA